ncbi:class E sortase [Streptomyces sp. A0958]|uniref:class E sortase n=1 Tax=Streptomyces sp. A0958 TaxID=2563101 RepID=UPI00109EAF1F|nr:class E sortase [Streptomyces sp. A0958]THA72257.1 class E sortase [Streptomyces sp. A0958]
MRAVVKRIPVVVQRDPRRGRLVARGLWTGAELVVTLGVVLLLLVAHQLWWTNRQARADAARTVHRLERDWGAPREQPDADADADADAGGGADEGADADADVLPGAGPSPGGGSPSPRSPSASEPASATPDQAYAVIRIPRISLTAPVAQGISRRAVLDQGYVGHYPATAQPGGRGNFALAGHRNTHGEPFRYINRLRAGDRITVETRDAVYTYTVDKTLARTTPGDSGVVAAVPRSNIAPYPGYHRAGSYLTLTTCTPEFTSRYRLVVWGKLTGVRER